MQPRVILVIPAWDEAESNGAVLGADSPTLPALVSREALAALMDGTDVALGPAEDGGYYLLVRSASLVSKLRPGLELVIHA